MSEKTYRRINLPEILEEVAKPDEPLYVYLMELERLITQEVEVDDAIDRVDREWVIEKSAVYSAGAVADGSFKAQDITVIEAELGDYVDVSFSADVTDLQLDAQVTAADVVTAVFYNQTGGSVNPSGTIYVKVVKK